MVYKLAYTSSAQQDMKRLPEKDAQRILNKLSVYIHHESPLKFAKKLKGLKIAHYRFRVGNYRVIFRIDPKSKKLVVLVVLKVAHRKEAYL